MDHQTTASLYGLIVAASIFGVSSFISFMLFFISFFSGDADIGGGKDICRVSSVMFALFGIIVSMIVAAISGLPFFEYWINQ